MKFISLCSGIEAASVAFGPLGWKAVAFSEIDTNPSLILAYHYPDVPNMGDMTKFREWPEELFVQADAIVGGPPCQAFSLAGARKGLDDARGNLTLVYVELINHADKIRKKHGRSPVIALYENVPGLLSDRTNAFGCLLGALAGEDDPLVAAGKKWTDAGCVFGPERHIAWRTLDAQFFQLAQRRRRVFVVASAREGFDPAAILFEPESLRRDSPPSRSAGQDTAGTIAARTDGGGFPGTDEACSGYVQPVDAVLRGGNTSGAIDVAACLTAKGQRIDFEVETFAVDVCPTLRAGGNSTGGDRPPGTDVDTADSLIVQTALSVALRGREGGGTAELGDDVATCLRASTGGGDKPHVLAPVASEHGTCPGQPIVVHGTQDPCTNDHVAFALWRNNGGENALMQGMAVRRLTPTECERLMGFPDSYTAIPMPDRRKDRKESDRRAAPRIMADGPRYKALGNSWAVPVVAWIGRRIDAHLRALDARRK